MRSAAIVGLVLGALIGVDPFGWDEVGPLRWLMVSVCGFAVVAWSGGRLVRDALTLLWGALIGWLGVAALFGADRLHAWIGTPDRHFGWLTWLLCGALFVVARRHVGQDHELRLVIRAVVIATLVGSIVAILEAFDLRLGEAPFAGDRLGGAFSQPALLGAASVLVFPITASLVADRDEATPWRIGAAVAAVGSVFMLAASQSRAAWLAGVVILGLGLWARRAELAAAWRHARPRWRAFGVGTVVAVVAIVAISVPVIDRLGRLFGGDGGLAGRIDEWQVAVRAIGARPLLGWGPEGYRIAFGRHVDVDYVIDHGRRVITDRAHSGLIDAGVVGGVPGAVLYGGLLVLLAFSLWRAVAGGTVAQVGLGLGALGYFTQQLVLFPVAELDPLAWLVAGLALAPATPIASGAAPVEQSSATFVLSPVGRGLAAGLAGVALLAGALDVAADHRVRNAVVADDPNAALAFADSARRLRGDSIRYDFIASRLAANLDDSRQRIDSALVVSPDDPALRGEQARLALDQALAGGDTTHAATALELLEALVADDANHPDHVGRLGIALAITGNAPGAEAAFAHAIRLDPDNRDHRQNLATLLETRKSS